MMDNKKLKPLAEQVLIGEIVNQSKFAEKAYEILARSSNSVEVWGSIQSILVAVANVSKILWPNKKHKARGKQLRELLDVSDDHMLSDRTFRNHFEHYDERVEEWFDNKNLAVYKDSIIDPFELTKLSLRQVSHRSYNPSNRVLSFRNESINLSAVFAALAEIREKCQSFALP